MTYNDDTMTTLRGYVWGLRNILVNYRYFENWYKLVLTPSIGKLKKYNLYFYFPTLKDLAYDSYVIRENFYMGQYDWLKCTNKVVLDIGANIGDTAMLFAIRGAKKVIAFEPYPYSFHRALKNIEINHMQSKILLLRAAVTNKNSRIKLSQGYSDGSTALNSTENGLMTETITLSSIIKRYKPKILKSDCEGSEYLFILSTPPRELAKFDQMIIDFHGKGYYDLSKHIQKAGFKTKIRLYEKTGMYGMIKAWK
ncbi:MAG: FkbM family methyltransferase [Caldisphaera sp.]